MYSSAKRVGTRLLECCRQSQAEVVSKNSNKVHQTWGPPFSRARYCVSFLGQLRNHLLAPELNSETRKHLSQHVSENVTLTSSSLMPLPPEVSDWRRKESLKTDSQWASTPLPDTGRSILLSAAQVAVRRKRGSY